MGSYLVIKNGQQIGPYDESEIIRQITEGILTPGDLCWQQGMANWQPISDFLNYSSTSTIQQPDLVSPATLPVASGNSLLYIPISRLILLYIATFGYFNIYWMYMNWNYIKKRDNLRITPFWRAFFGLLFCYDLLRHIHEDPESRSYQMPAFSPTLLTIGWAVLVIIAYGIDQIHGRWTTILSAFVPSYMCLVPVQLYINTVRQKKNPGEPYFNWSPGQIIILIIGCIMWLFFTFYGVVETMMDH